MLTCAACGIRQSEDTGNYGRVPLSSALVLSVNENFDDDHGNVLKTFGANGLHRCEQVILQRSPTTGAYNFHSTFGKRQ